jgi:hypothetical protein
MPVKISPALVSLLIAGRSAACSGQSAERFDLFTPLIPEQPARGKHFLETSAAHFFSAANNIEDVTDYITPAPFPQYKRYRWKRC